MSSRNFHPMTFLRSAIAKDPFCLGDLGPEDVLRIEAYYPELFKPPGCLENPVPNYPKPIRPSTPIATSKISINDSGMPVRPALSQKFSSTSRKNLTGTHFTCSRGDRCLAHKNDKPASSTLPKSKPTLTSTSRPKKLPLVGTKSEVVKRLPEKLSLVRTGNNVDLRRNVSPSQFLEKFQKVQISTRNASTEMDDNIGYSPSGGVKLISLSPIKNKIKHHRPHLESHSVPIFPGRKSDKAAVDKSPKFLKRGTRERQLLVDNLQNIITNFVKSPDPKTTPKRKPETEPTLVLFPPPKPKSTPKPKPSPGPGFIRPLLTNPVLNRNLKERRQHKHRTELVKKPENDTNPAEFSVNVVDIENRRKLSRTVNSDTSFEEKISNGESEALLKRLEAVKGQNQCGDASDSSSFTNSLSIANLSPTRIRRPKILSSEIISENISAGDQLQDRSVDRFEQLMLARILASKYEKDGKFSKWNINSKVGTSAAKDKADIVKHRESMRTRTIFPEIPSEADTHILEKIAEDLIRTEVLKCIHNETEESNYAKMSDLDPTDQRYGARPLNSRLTPIDEEKSEILITPDLTPPPPPKMVQGYWKDYRQPINDDDEVSVSTPVPTLPGSIRDDILKLAKTMKVHSHDTTDCSSMSDFVVSEAEKVSKPRVRENSPTSNSSHVPGLFEMKTPEWTPPASLSELLAKQSSAMDSINTPIATPRLNSTKSKKSLSEELNVRFEDLIPKIKTSTPKSTSRSRSRQPKISEEPQPTPERSPKSKSFADALSDFEKSVTSGFQRLYSEIMSDGEFLGDHYNSPGQLTISFSDLSPGLYLSDIDTEDLSLSGIETITEDTEVTPSFSAGEHRS